ncbi:MAG: hypothetical protein HFK09_01635 [Clostridia bacterium]|nr:hypothetical protein [Clostridia bacterium]
MTILSNAGMNSVATDILFAVIMGLLTISVLIVGVWLLVRFLGKDKNEKPKDERLFAKVLSLLICGGVLVRIIFMLLVKGHREDFDIIAETMEYIGKNGFSDYYGAKGILLYPLILLLYSPLGLITNAVGLTSSSYAMGIFVKLPLIAADIGVACVMYKLAKRYVNGYVALIIAGMFLLTPIFMISSSVWGSIYSLLSLAFILCMYFTATKNILGLFASYTASLLVMKESLFLFPLFAVFILYGFIKALNKTVKEKIPSSELWNNPDTCQVIRTPIYLVSSVALGYIISLPTFIGSFGASFFGFVYNFGLKPLASVSTFGTNSLGIFNIFGRNADSLGSTFPTVVFAVIFAVIITGIVLLIYLSKKNRANLVYLGAYIIFTLATYYVGFSALSLVPVLAMLLMSFILIKDKRILHVFGLLSLITFVNATAVLIRAGYLNFASDYMFDSSFYTGTTTLDSGAGMAVSIVCSVLAVATHLYSTLVLLDLAMSGKRKVFQPSASANPLQSLAIWFKK